MSVIKNFYSCSAMDELVFFTLDESFVEFHGGGGPSFFEPSLHSLI